MAEPLEPLHLPPQVEVINPEYFLVPPEERARRNQAWLDSLRTIGEPIALPVSGADLVADSRREEEWWPSGT